MDFCFEHEIAAEVDALARVVLAPDLPARIADHVPTIAAAWETERRELDGGVVERAVRFRPAARPPGFLASRLPPDALEWVERTRWDARARAGTFVIEPDVPPAWRRYFEGFGSYRLERRGPGRTARVVAGTLRVGVAALLRPLAERFAREQLRRHYAGEARLLAAVVVAG